MIVPVDAILRREVGETSLRFTCEHCAHFAEATAARPAGCSLGFPHEPHLARSFDRDDVGFAFCKAFELS